MLNYANINKISSCDGDRDNTCNANSYNRLFDSFQEKNPFRDMFFSDQNIQFIQSGIKRIIYEKTSGKIRLSCNQKKDDIVLAMTHVYVDEGQFDINDMKNCIIKLDMKVIELIIPGMLTNIKQYL